MGSDVWCFHVSATALMTAGSTATRTDSVGGWSQDGAESPRLSRGSSSDDLGCCHVVLRSVSSLARTLTVALPTDAGDMSSSHGTDGSSGGRQHCARPCRAVNAKRVETAFRFCVANTPPTRPQRIHTARGRPSSKRRPDQASPSRSSCSGPSMVRRVCDQPFVSSSAAFPAIPGRSVLQLSRAVLISGPMRNL